MSHWTLILKQIATAGYSSQIETHVPEDQDMTVITAEHIEKIVERQQRLAFEEIFKPTNILGFRVAVGGKADQAKPQQQQR